MKYNKLETNARTVCARVAEESPPVLPALYLLNYDLSTEF